MTEMTSVGQDMKSVVVCLCVNEPNQINSLVDLYRKEVEMTHEHDFVKDLDGQVTCAICGAMDDEKLSIFETQVDFE